MNIKNTIGMCIIFAISAASMLYWTNAEETHKNIKNDNDEHQDCHDCDSDKTENKNNVKSNNHDDHSHKDQQEDSHDDHQEKECQDTHENHNHKQKESGCQEGHNHSDHEGHAHDDHQEKECQDTHDHISHTNNNHTQAESGCKGGHDHSDHESGLILTEKQKQEIGLKTSLAGSGNLLTELTLPGEVVLNEDTVVHMVARVPGIVLKVNKSLGDRVKKGDVLAVLDSAELGEAKAVYYERFNELGCCSIDLNRAEVIERNTGNAIEDLKKLPSLDELKKKNYGDMGEYRARLLATYTDFLINRKSYERNKNLYEKNIVSENEYLKEHNSYLKAKAEFFSKLHDASFKIMQDLQDKQQQMRVNEFKLKTAERKLLILGMTKQDITALQKDLKPLGGNNSNCQCNSSTCKTCQDKSGNSTENNSFTIYKMIAPQDGIITSRHISKGEKIDDKEEVFTIADISTVWVNLQIPGKDIPLIKPGCHVVLELPTGGKASGKVAFIGPVLDKQTRTATARIILDNDSEEWKPGSYVTGHVRISAKNLPVVIPRAAVQTINDEDIVFVPKNNGFETVVVDLGQSDGQSIEIKSGLRAGNAFVAKGAFELKAMQITQGLDPHAGHGH